MPVELLSKSERGKLSRFPKEIPHENLRLHLTLSEEDRDAASRFYGKANPLGSALAPLAPRYLELFLPDLTDAPEEAARYVPIRLASVPMCSKNTAREHGP